MELLVVQFPRGRTGAVWFDPATEVMWTANAGLHALLQRGVKDFGGRPLSPSDGRQFLSALYDHLFLNGYGVHWLRALRSPGFAADPVDERRL